MRMRLERHGRLTTSWFCGLLLLAILVGTHAAAQPVWSSYAVVNSDGPNDSDNDLYPKAASDGAGNLVVMWMSRQSPFDTPDWEVYVSTSADGGATWTPQALVDPAASTLSRHDEFPSVATDGQGVWRAVFVSEDRTDSEIHYVVQHVESTNNGASWTSPVQLGINLDNTWGDYAPYLAVDRSGNWMTVWDCDEMVDTSGYYDADIFVSRMPSGTSAWTSPAPLNVNSTVDLCNDDTYAATAGDGEGNWVTAWHSTNSLEPTGTPDFDILFSTSSDNGVTWSYPAFLNDNATTDTTSDYMPHIATDEAGAWIAVWQYHEDNDNIDVYMARSTDAGQTWSSRVQLNTGTATDTERNISPQVTTDKAGNWIVVWEHQTTATSRDGDIYLVHSTDKGLTWTAPACIHGTDAGDNRLPHLVNDGHGNWTALWSSSMANEVSGTGAYYDVVRGTTAVATIPPVIESVTALDCTTVRVVFSQAMLNNAALATPAQYAVSGGLAIGSAVRVNGSTVDLSVDEMLDGEAYTLTIATDSTSPENLAGQHIEAGANSASFAGIGVPPVVSISAIGPAYAKDGDTVTVEVIATDNVGVSGNPAVTLNGVAMSFASVNGSAYTYTLVLPAGSLEGAATVEASAADAAGNSGSAGSNSAPIIDNTPPTVSITLDGSSPTGADTVTFHVVFSEAVAGTFTEADLIPLSSESIEADLSFAISGTDPVYTVAATLDDPNVDGELGIIIFGAGVTDVAGNPCGDGESDLYTLCNWHGFSQEPQSARTYAGDPHSLAVIANCCADTLAYQWRWDDGGKAVHDAGPDAATWDIADVSGLAGAYWCEVTYEGSTYYSTTATLEVADHLAITQPPSGGDYTAGDSHTFSVTTTGGYSPLTYSWKKDGDEVSSDSVYALAELAVENTGQYTVEVTDDNGDLAASAPVQLTVEPGMPATGLTGLGVLAAGMALASIFSLRRAKQN